MKVLRKGKPWSMKATCTGSGNGGGGCKAVLEVEEADLYRTSSSHYDGSTDEYITFKCCECGAETDISERNVPERIQRTLRDKPRPGRGARD